MIDTNFIYFRIGEPNIENKMRNHFFYLFRKMDSGSNGEKYHVLTIKYEIDDESKSIRNPKISEGIFDKDFLEDWIEKHKFEKIKKDDIERKRELKSKYPYLNSYI